MIFRVLLGNVQNFSLFWKLLFWQLERVNVADPTGFARSLLVVPDRGVLLLLLFLGIFIVDWFQSHIQRRWTDIKKHRICYVAIVQILHVLVEKSKHNRTSDVIVSIQVDELDILVFEGDPEFDGEAPDDVGVEVECQYFIVEGPNRMILFHTLHERFQVYYLRSNIFCYFLDRFVDR